MIRCVVQLLRIIEMFHGLMNNPVYRLLLLLTQRDVLYQKKKKRMSVVFNVTVTTHTHTHTLTHTHTHSRKHTLTHTLTQTQTHTDKDFRYNLKERPMTEFK